MYGRIAEQCRKQVPADDSSSSSSSSRKICKALASIKAKANLNIKLEKNEIKMNETKMVVKHSKKVRKYYMQECFKQAKQLH